MCRVVGRIAPGAAKQGVVERSLGSDALARLAPMPIRYQATERHHRPISSEAKQDPAVNDNYISPGSGE